MITHHWRKAGSRAAMWLFLLLVGFLFVAPVAMLIIGIFWDAPPGLPGQWTLATLRQTFADHATYVAFGNSLFFATTTTLLATLLGAVFAFISTRTTVPLRGCITPVMMLLFAAPNLFYAISWGLLADPYAGLLNDAARLVTGLDVSPFNAYSWPGLIVVQSLKLSGFCYLLLLAPFQGMNRSLEEASLIAGAGRLTTLLKINLPLMTPALLGIVIVGMVFGLGAFDVPQILGGLPQISVLSTEVFRAVNFTVPPDYARASALSLFMIAALALLLGIQWRVVRAGRFVTITGKSNSHDRWNIGYWQYPATAAIVVFAIIALILPVSQLVIASFQPALGLYSFTTQNFDEVLGDRQTFAAFRMTAELAVLAGFLAMGLATIAAYLGRRSSRWVERYLDTATLLPIVMPGVVLAIGLMWVYVSTPGLRKLYATYWLALIGLVVVIMPIASRAVRGAITQIAKELEEAAAVSGASPTRVFIDVVLRLMSRSFLTGWLVTSVIAAGSLDVPLMLLPSARPNVAVLVYSHIIAGIPTQASALLVLLLAAIAAVTLVCGVLGAILMRSGRRVTLAAAE